VVAVRAVASELDRDARNHVAPGRVTAAHARGLTVAPTVNGEELAMSANGTIHVDGAQVVSADIEASNGLIDVIDQVLIPATI
jgi:uncharacterized surface protein with fasciclin (FAS1) repeats